MFKFITYFFSFLFPLLFCLSNQASTAKGLAAVGKKLSINQAKNAKLEEIFGEDIVKLLSQDRIKLANDFLEDNNLTVNGRVRVPSRKNWFSKLFFHSFDIKNPDHILALKKDFLLRYGPFTTAKGKGGFFLRNYVRHLDNLKTNSVSVDDRTLSKGALDLGAAIISLGSDTIADFGNNFFRELATEYASFFSDKNNTALLIANEFFEVNIHTSDLLNSIAVDDLFTMNKHGLVKAHKAAFGVPGPEVNFARQANLKNKVHSLLKDVLNAGEQSEVTKANEAYQHLVDIQDLAKADGDRDFVSWIDEVVSNFEDSL